MAIPNDYQLTTAQWIQDANTQEVFWACNCGSQLATRTLRFVAANRQLFNVWPTPAPAENTTGTPTNGVST